MTEKKEWPFFHPVPLLCTWFGAGRSPKAPGTMGSLAALPFAYLIHTAGGGMALLGASIVVFLIGWVLSDEYIKQYGGEDPQAIVIDEVAGMWLLCSVMQPALIPYLMAFALFRLFDIKKPWPVSWCDRNIKGGLGVMIDDMVAAAIPALFIFFLQQFFLWGVNHVQLIPAQ